MITSITEYYNRRRNPSQPSTIRVWFTETAATLESELTLSEYLEKVIEEFLRVLTNEIFRPYRLNRRQQENLPVYMTLENGGMWSRATTNELVHVLTENNLMDMISMFQQSNREVNIFDSEWALTIDSNFYSRGSGGPIKPKYTNKTYELTHQVYSDEQGLINCAAFALSFRMNKASYRNMKRPTVKARIVKEARELQTKLGWTDSVGQDQLKEFVDMFPEYRVTVLNPSGIVRDFNNSTFTGSQYVYTGEHVTEASSNTIYLGLMDNHWYAIGSPHEYFLQEAKIRTLFCHKCLYKYHQSYRHDCDNPDLKYKKPRQTKSCDQCGMYLDRKSKCSCQETKCTTCCINYKTGTTHKRCLVTKPSSVPKNQEQFANGEDKNFAALWVYDLESCMETVMVEKEQIVDFDPRGIPVRACNIYKHQPNLCIAKNVITGEMKEWYGTSAITEMVQFMITYNYGNNILIAHNASGYDSRLVYEEITRQVSGIEIKCLFRGSKILSMTATRKGANRYASAKLVFKDSMLHLPGSLAALAKAFCQGKMIKGYFPHLFNTPENQDYIGPIPDKKYFDMTMSAKDEDALQKFNDWYHAWEGEWNFKKELIKYCRNDVDMLADIVAQYDQIYYESFGAHPFYYTTTPAAMQDVSLRQQRERMNIDRECFDSDEEYIEHINQLAQDEEWATLIYAEQSFARECLRGGKTEIRRVYYKLSEEEKARGCKIVLQDICSQYPYQQVKHDFPVGVPHVMVWDYPADYNEKINVEYMTEQPTYEDIKNWRGFICCDIHPPNNGFHATLIENDTDRNKAISSFEFKQRKHFVFDEVKVAIERDGYELKKVYRFDKYNYRDSKWTDLVLKCYLNKMKYSKNIPSEEEQERLVHDYEERFDFGEEVRKSFPEWQKNDAKKLVFKIGTNSIWGKNAENTERDDPATTLDCETSLDRINLIFQNINENKCTFKSMHLVGNMHQIITKSMITPQNSYHGGYLPAAVCVPSYGRMQLNAELVKLGDRVLMHDTDSIMYIYDPQAYNIPEDDVLGGWEVENDQIEEFVGMAPKTYAYKCFDGKTKVKCKGVSITNFHKEIVNFQTMKDLVVTYLETKEIKTIQVPQRSFDYKVGQGMTTRKFLKQLRFNPNDMKGILDRRDGKIYPFGHVIQSDIDAWEYINE